LIENSRDYRSRLSDGPGKGVTSFRKERLQPADPAPLDDDGLFGALTRRFYRGDLCADLFDGGSLLMPLRAGEAPPSRAAPGEPVPHTNGEPFACTALGVVRNDTVLGKLANNRLGSFAADANLQINPRDVSVDFINRYGNDQQLLSSPSNPQWPSASRITTQHYQTFDRFRLPPRTFGGTPFAGTRLEGLSVPRGVWCNGCGP
jgi:hypothetical protein